jgi:uncharacterized protein YuzE
MRSVLRISFRRAPPHGEQHRNGDDHGGGNIAAANMRRDKFKHSRYKRDVRPEREAKAMTDITYDAEADAVYIAVGRGRAARTRKAGPFVYDLDAAGRIVGIEILSASKVLAPGDWEKARRPKESRRLPRRATELHKGFLFIKRFSPDDVESQ